MYFFQTLFWPTVRKNCSCDCEKLLGSLEHFIRTVKGQYNFCNRILFWLFPGCFSEHMLLTCYWRFLQIRYIHTLEQLKCLLQQLIGMNKPGAYRNKLEKVHLFKLNFIVHNFKAMKYIALHNLNVSCTWPN